MVTLTNAFHYLLLEKAGGVCDSVNSLLSDEKCKFQLKFKTFKNYLEIFHRTLAILRKLF